MALATRLLTLFKPGFSWASRTGGGGWGRILLPHLNSDNIEAMNTKLEEQRVRPKTFPLRSTTLADDDI